ncbi:aspartyl protease family protein [Candidatus Fermentibacteria bacterium]|nr:aspartyl protease family protein [Candidatus Fermentibacteria bacterium]
MNTVHIGLLVLSVVETAAVGLSETPDPYVILDQHIVAMGGWTAIDSHQAIHSKGTLVLEGTGLGGTIETWSMLPDKSRQEFDIQVISQVSGDNGDYAWRVDQNGKLQIARDAATVKERQLEVLKATREHIKRGSAVFTVTYAREDTAAGSICHVLTTTNTINSFIQNDYYDTTSYLLIKSIVVKPDGEVHTVNRDYRDVEGVLYPFTVEQLELPTSQSTTIRIVSLEVNAPMDQALFEPPQERARDFRFPPGLACVEVAFQFIERHVYLPLTVGGQSRLWILDSGAGATVIEKEFATALDLPQEGKLVGRGATSTAEFSLSRLPPFEIGGVEFDSQTVAVFSLNDMMRKVLGFEVGGILGYDFLSRLVTKVDFANERLTFCDPDSFSYAGDGVVLDAPLSKSNMLQIPITVDGRYHGLWDLDLGAGGTTFFYPYAEEHGLLGRAGVTRIGFGAGGDQEATTAQFDSISMAGLTVIKPLIEIPAAKGTGSFASSEITGNAGNDFLSRFTLFLDYTREQVIVEKGGGFDTESPVDRSGLQVIMGESRKVEVLTVPEGTPGAIAGIQRGDVVSAIDGKSAEELGGILRIREMLRASAGTEYELSLVRDGQVLVATLRLANLYE